MTTVETLDAVMAALRGLDGRATVGDVIAATGLAREHAQLALRELLSTHRGHLSVGEAGDLLWEFDPELIRRDEVSGWTRFKHWLRRALTNGFKVWIMLMLVVYFVVFVALALAAMVAMMSGGRRSSRRGYRMRIPTWWLWYLFWTRGWRMGRPYYGHDIEQRRGSGGAPFYKKVFAFVFGTDEPRLTPEQRDREIIALIRARRGVLTTAELISYTGLSLPEATSEMGRLMGALNGDVRVTQDGKLIYVFPELMVSAQGSIAAREPPPAWQRLERPRPITGNARGSDMLISALNGFNLLAAATSPWTIFPQVGIGGGVAMALLVWVPLLFSVLLFLVPLLRRVGVRRENEKRRRRNVRKLLLGRVFRAAVEAEPVTAEVAAAATRAVLEDRSIGDHVVADELGMIATEFEAEAEANPRGGLGFRFAGLRNELEAGERVRAALALEQQRLGAIVYSTADAPAEESVRDMAAFDTELRQWLAPSEPAYADEFDVSDNGEENS